MYHIVWFTYIHRYIELKYKFYIQKIRNSESKIVNASAATCCRAIVMSFEPFQNVIVMTAVTTQRTKCH